LRYAGNTFIIAYKGKKRMADNMAQFIRLANFYNELARVMAAVCAQKNIAAENYVGRFVMADVLEFIAAFGRKHETGDTRQDIKALVAKFEAEFEKVKDLTTPSQKPIHEMTLAEFEKVMNI
jgi:class 3 adenylate cyclase